MIHRHDEFGLHISWRPRRGTWKDMAPGFYLTVGWSNEGEADYPVKDMRLSEGQFLAFMSVVDDVVDGDSSFTRSAETMLKSVAEAADRRRTQLIEQIEKAQRELAELQTGTEDE